MTDRVISGRGLALAAASVLVIGLLFLSMCPMAVNVDRGEVRRISCLNNEKQIALAMIVYREDTGHCARTLNDLRKYINSDQVFHCPNAADSPPLSYTIHCTTNATEVMVSEDPANHHGFGSNVGYGDGHVEWKSTRR